MLAGYHQYFAVRKAIEKAKVATKTDGKGGVFWHTQGSGKSLSMVFYAHLLQDALDSPTIVVMTDRIDLDDTNFVDIVFQKQRLRISINMKFSEINDPNSICKDITGLGRWGNGDVELFMEHQDELDQIMEIVKQSFDAQAE